MDFVFHSSDSYSPRHNRQLFAQKKLLCINKQERNQRKSVARNHTPGKATLKFVSPRAVVGIAQKTTTAGRSSCCERKWRRKSLLNPKVNSQFNPGGLYIRPLPSPRTVNPPGRAAHKNNSILIKHKAERGGRRPASSSKFPFVMTTVIIIRNCRPRIFTARGYNTRTGEESSKDEENHLETLAS